MPRLDDADEDWVDGLKASSRRKDPKRPLKGRGRELSAAEGNATVTGIFPNQAAVLPDAGPGPSLCSYQMRTLAFGGASRERSPVCVGDRVRVRAGVIVGRCARRNRLMRSAPNSRDPLLHAVAANLDLLVVVAAALQPEFTPGIVDRFLVAASSQEIPPILVVNKSDLLALGQPKVWAHYSQEGVTVVETSARTGSGIGALKEIIRGKTAAFCGHSGVGKTSLLRRLLEDEGLGRIGELSAHTGMGRHTTTGAVLLAGPGGSAWIDTPGIMNFMLVGVDRSLLLGYFPELREASQRCPPDCLHAGEPACALRGMPRHSSYQEILRSL